MAKGWDCSIVFAGWGLLVWVNWKGNKLANWGFQSGVCWVGLDQSSLLVLVYWEGDLLGWLVQKGGLQSRVCKVGLGIGSGLLDLVCSIMFAGLGFLIWVHWEGESLANWSLQCWVFEVYFTK